jgi:hypothetical protein
MSNVRVVRLLLTFPLVTLTGCAFMFAGIQKEADTCSTKIAELTALDSSPPGRGFDGDWQCMYTAGTGHQMVERLAWVTNGTRLTIVGRDNYGSNIAQEGTIGGRSAVYRDGDRAGFKLVLDPSGRLLDGAYIYWGESEDGMTCVQSRYVCRR